MRRGFGQVYLRGTVWWIKYYRNGQMMRESSRSTKQADADRLLRQKVGDIEHGRPVSPKWDRLRFDEAAKDLETEYTVAGRRSGDELERRIRLHLLPYFGNRRMVSITPADIMAFVQTRQADTVLVRKARRKKTRKGWLEISEQRRPVSNGEINRELTTPKRIFNLAVENGRLLYRPTIKLLKERNTRTGFFEADQFQALLRQLPAELQPPLAFAYITGWRIPSEVLPLQWRQVDFEAGTVRLDPHTTKNDDGRVFPFTDALRLLLETQKAEADRLKKKGTICPWVFHRNGVVRKGKKGVKVDGVRIVTLTKAFNAACRAAGCPGRIPHDLRRTAVRNLVRAGIPERVAMQMTGHKTRSVFERYNIVSPGDLTEAAKKLNAVQSSILPATESPDGHNSGTIGPSEHRSRLAASL